MELRSSGLVVGSFTCWAILLAPDVLQLQNAILVRYYIALKKRYEIIALITFEQTFPEKFSVYSYSLLLGF